MEPASPPPEVLARREIRIFISSTFRDMMRERDLLVKRVFPELRRKFAQRFVTFTEVDLRWGITSEQAAEGQVLPLCLAEIERSRPYFLGLLGERYGWIPDGFPAEIVARQPWLREHVQGRTSVTELEILHGVLNDPAMRGLAFFYFRDPGYANDPSLSDDERAELLERDIPAEVQSLGAVEAARRTEERKAKLAALKQRIRESRHPLVEPYANPEALADLVLHQFDELIDRLYPEPEVPDAITRERMAHEAHAKHKLFACIDRPVHLDAVNAFAELPEHDGKGLVVTGESGCGKSAVLAAWARDWIAAHPDDFLFQHYFGATPQSASSEGFLSRLLGEMKAHFGIADEIPPQPDKLREVLPLWLAQSFGKGRLVLVLDGLHQVTGSDPDRRLAFLPRHFPPNVAVIASTLPGPALDVLRERGWSEHELPLANEQEIDAMAGAYLSIHARALDPEIRRDLVTAPGSRNPLFLRTVLEELRQVGSFESLPDRVRYYLEAAAPKDLFLLVIQRWEKDFGGNEGAVTATPDLVCRALTLLWAAREGLSEPEWLDLLGDSHDPLPRAHWTPLFLAIEPHLSQRAGVLAFNHGFLRDAVEAAFLPSADARRGAHLAIADYFENHAQQREMSSRKAAEWPWHVRAAEEWERLEVCLTDLSLFVSLFRDTSMWELTGYWHPLRRRGREMGACYAHAYQRWIETPENVEDHWIADLLGRFLAANGLYGAAEPFFRRALEIRERTLGPEHSATTASLNNLGFLLGSVGDHTGAELLLRRVLETRERMLGSGHPDTLDVANNLGFLLFQEGDLANAEPLLRRTLEARELVLGPDHSSTLQSANNLALLLESKGDLSGAESLLRRALEAGERVLGLEHPWTLASVNNLALILRRTGDDAGATALFLRSLQASERILGPQHPDTLTSVYNQALLMLEDGDATNAESLLRRASEGRERVLGFAHVATLASTHQLAVLLVQKGDLDAAESLLRRVLETREQVLGRDHPDTLTTANDLAVLITRRGDVPGAQSLYERTLEGRERVLGPEHADTLASVDNVAFVRARNGDPAGAELLRRRALDARARALGPDHPATLESVNNLAALLARRGDVENARMLRCQVLETRERVLGPHHPDTLLSVKMLASLLATAGDLAAAQSLYRRALEGNLRISKMAGTVHATLHTSLDDYVRCLEMQEHKRESIRASLIELATPLGMQHVASELWRLRASKRKMRRLKLAGGCAMPFVTFTLLCVWYYGPRWWWGILMGICVMAVPLSFITVFLLAGNLRYQRTRRQPPE